MQSNRTTPSRAAGVGTTLSLLLLGILLTLAAFYFCLKHLGPRIEADLTARVTEALDGAGIADTRITVEGQDVTLWGKIADQATKEKAGQLAAGVYGISGVSNQLTIDGEATTPGQTATEAALNSAQNSLGDEAVTETIADDTKPPIADITAKKPELVLPDPLPIAPKPKTPQDAPTPTAESNSKSVNSNSLTGNNESEEALSPSTLDISVVDDQVVVQGIVPDVDSIERINAALVEKFGRNNVEDDMSTYVGSAEPMWLDNAIALIDQMDDVQNLSLKITQNSAIISGQVSSETFGNAKSALAQKLLGENLSVSTDLKLIKKSSKLPAPEAKPRTITKRPASLKIISLEGETQLTGTVSSLREARSVRDNMNNIFGSQFSDDLIVDSSVAKSDWLNEAMVVTDSVQSLNNFSVSINSGQLLLSGDVIDRDIGRELTRDARKITNGKLDVISSFSTQSPQTIQSEDVFAQALKQELDALDTAAIVFNKGRTTLTDDAKKVLDQVAVTILGFKDEVVEIAGHTDSSGDALANLELSRKRAAAVRDYLIEQNVPTGRLQPIGYGETKPVADNETPEGQTANRRIEFNL